MRLAVFDIDGTLIRRPSLERRLFRHLRERGLIGFSAMTHFALFALRWLPRYGIEVLKRDKAWLTGIRPATLEPVVAGWLENELPGAFNHAALTRLRRHQQAGDIVALVSGAPDFVVSELARRLGIEHFVGTRAAVSNGVFTSVPPTLHPFGEAKVDIVAGLAQRLGVPLAHVTAYGDAIDDLPLLRTVGTPVVVAPDPKLRAAARAAGWELLSEGALPR
jgi:HAD superfamily hydrolase (TIGR01490 family)